MKKMLDSCFKTNPLHPELFPMIRKMEADLINFGLELFKAPETGAGSTTMGGTESILLACKTYRDKENKWYPNIVAFQTVHPAFDKACQYFKIELRKSNNLKEFRDRAGIQYSSNIVIGNDPGPGSLYSIFFKMMNCMIYLLLAIIIIIILSLFLL